MIKVSVFDRSDFARCAKAKYACGNNEHGHLLSAVAAKTECEEEQFVRAHKVYCDWIAENLRAARVRAIYGL